MPGLTWGQIHIKLYNIQHKETIDMLLMEINVTYFQTGDSLLWCVGILPQLHLCPQRNVSQDAHLCVRHVIDEAACVLRAVFAEVETSHVGLDIGKG